MEIQLKIDLTDEQYKELMETSYQKLFEGEDFQKALGDLVLNNMADFLAKNPDLIRGMLCKESSSSGYYNYNRWHDITETAKIILGKASEESANKVKSVCCTAMDDVLKDDNLFNKIFRECLTTSMINGMVDGMREFVNAQHCTDEMIAYKLKEARERIGLEEN